ALRHAKLHAAYQDGLGQQVAVVGDLPEGVVRAQVVGDGQEELNPARRTGMGPAQPVTPRSYLEERLNLSAHQQLIAQKALPVEQMEEEVAGIGVEQLVADKHWDIELAAGKAEAGGFVPGIKVVEQQKLADQTLVDVLRGKVDAVIVVEECAQGLANVALGGG